SMPTCARDGRVCLELAGSARSEANATFANATTSLKTSDPSLASASMRSSSSSCTTTDCTIAAADHTETPTLCIPSTQLPATTDGAAARAKPTTTTTTDRTRAHLTESRTDEQYKSRPTHPHRHKASMRTIESIVTFEKRAGTFRVDTKRVSSPSTTNQ